MPTPEELWEQALQAKGRPTPEQLWDQSVQTHQGGTGVDIGGLQPDTRRMVEGARGRDPSVDYSQGAPLHVRGIAQWHSSTPGPSGKSEQELYLTKYYGDGNVRQDQGGSFLVRDSDGQPWKPVFPSGMLGMAGNTLTGAAAAVPTTAGAVGGSILGAPGGPAGMVAGAMGGASLGKAGVEGLKALSGTYDKTPGALALETGVEAGLPAIFQGMPAMGRAATSGGSNVARDVLQRWGRVTPESRDVTLSLERLGTNPPISSVAPGLKVFEYDRRLRNMVMSDPKAAERGAAVQTRMREVLQRFGVVGPDLDRAMQQIMTRSEALSEQDAAAPTLERLSGDEQALRKTAQENFNRARDLLRNQVEQYKTSFSGKISPIGPRGRMEPGIGALGQDFEQTYTQAEQGFRQYFNEMYGAIDDLSQGSRYVDMSTAPNNTLKLIGDIFKNQGRDPPDLTQPLTYTEAHTIRSVLRDQAHMDEVSPLGVNRTSNLRYVQGIVDSAIRNTEDVVGQQVATALREADTQFAEQVRTFTNAKIQKIVYDTRQGRAPNPDVVARTIIDSDNTSATRQMWDILPSSMQTRVANAYMKDIFDTASVQGNDGRWTVDPNTLLTKIRDVKSAHPFIDQGSMLKQIETLATNLRALGGDVDVTALNTSTNRTSGAIRQHLEQALGATRTLAEIAEANPRVALSSENPELVRQGAKWFLGNEARTVQGAERLGVNSPEWQNVQRYAVQEMFKSALRPQKGLGETVSGRAIEDVLSKLTPQQQQLLFGQTARDDITLLAKQARALFPEMDEEFGGSLAAASIKGGFSKGKAGFLSSARAYTVSAIAGRIADSPALTRMLVGTLRSNPTEGRALLRWVLEGGMDTYVQTQRQQGQGTPTPDPMQFQGLQPVPKGDRGRVRPNLYQ